jgi:hypothetical protein
MSLPPPRLRVLAEVLTSGREPTLETLELIRAAFTAAELWPELFPGPDGALLVVDGSPVTVAADVVTGLAGVLRDDLVLALHAGLVHLRAGVPSGTAVRRCAELARDPGIRRPGLVVVVSPEFHADVIAHDYPGIEAGSYRNLGGTWVRVLPLPAPFVEAPSLVRAPLAEAAVPRRRSMSLAEARELLAGLD